jgi:hypothetical protein
MRTSTAAALACVAIAIAAPSGADEDALVRAYVGRPVQILMDLPATTQGLDYYPRRPDPMDARERQARLSSNGVGVPANGVVVVTKIKVKKDHVEFHLGAGGRSQMPSRPSTYVPESKLEGELEKQLKEATTEQEKKRLRAELAEERDRRDRERRRREARAERSYQEALSQHTPEEWALLAGSRVNVRFDGRVPADVLTPQGFARALGAVADFNPTPDAIAAGGQGDEDVEAGAGLPAHKGESREDLDARLGPPDDCSASRQGGVQVQTCTYDLDEATLEASFAGGLLVRFVITSN